VLNIRFLHRQLLARVKLLAISGPV
jgi:hypothetical protein